MPKTLICVPLMVEDAEQTLADAQAARDQGADLVELRLDRLLSEHDQHKTAELALQLAGQLPMPCIVTCRPASEGGEYDGDDDVRASLLSALFNGGGEHPPAYIDVELSSLGHSSALDKALSDATDRQGEAPRLILSHHDFNGRPERLFDILGKLRDCDGARVLKLVWKARSLRDNLEIFELLLERDRPTIALVMGEAGLMSRVLAAKFGGFLTFASLRSTQGTAPGQPTVRALIDRFRFGSINETTSVYGIVGWPVSHSISPDIHNASFEAAGVNSVYLPMPIATGWESFKATVLAMLDFKPLDLRGLSVTIPHKEHLVRLAREDQTCSWTIDPHALRIGAANTLTIGEDGTCHVSNTDVAGVVEPLRRALLDQARMFKGARVAIVGAGGSARAASACLAIEGCDVTIYARRDERAQSLAKELGASCADEIEAAGGSLNAGSWRELNTIDAEILINCTPIGMKGGPSPDELAIPIDAIVKSTQHPEHIIVFDLVYTPMQTPLLTTAKQCGVTTISGLNMFVEQAGRQFEAWTGRTAPHGLIERVARETLGASEA